MVAIKETNEHLAFDAPEMSTAEALEVLNKARTILKRRLSFFVWQGFFEPLSALSLADKTLVIEAPTSFHRNWVMDHYMGELNSAVAEVYGEDLRIDIICSEIQKKLPPAKKNKIKVKESSEPKETKEYKEIKDIKEQQENHSPSDLPTHAQADATVLPLSSNTSLYSRCSFGTFVYGPSNQMAYTASLSVAEDPGAQFSPLFLFGGVGLGKTHLLHAIGLRAKEKKPTLKVVYLSAEQWVNSYIQAIRERQFDSFRNRYRNVCDILLIDDIQFLAGKDASQDEFFHTFNCLHEAKKQIVVSSDKYPHEISGLEERLQTRLSWGLIADIRPPEIETRIAILHKKAEKLGVQLSDDVLNYLATTVTSSVRELEGALVRLAACSSFNKEPLISLNQTKEILAPVIKKKNVVVSWQKVCDVVARYYDLRTADLIGQARQRQVVFARQVAMACCRTMLNLSSPEIGRIFGGRDHSTVLSSLKKIDAQKRIDVSFQAILLKIENQINVVATTNIIRNE
jgi:chromosomal replication initiator protein